MARVTVEDCIVKVPNRFELVLLASQRARALSAGAEETLDRDNDKNPVVALREIAEGTVNVQELNDDLVFGLQKYVEVDEPEDDSTAILAAAEAEWAGVVTEHAEANKPEETVGEEELKAEGGDAPVTGESGGFEDVTPSDEEKSTESTD